MKAQKYQINTDFIFLDGNPEEGYYTHGCMEGEIYDTLEEAKAEFDSMVAGADEGEIIDLALIEVDEEDGWYDILDYIECAGPIGYPDDVHIVGD